MRLRFFLPLCLTLTQVICHAQTAGPNSVESLLDLTRSNVAVTEYYPQTFEYPLTGAAPNRGWNSYLEQPTTASCVTGREIPLKVNTNRVDVTDIYDREQLLSTLKVSAKASYGSASAKASYSRSLKIDRSKRNMLVSVDIIFDGVTLTPESSATPIALTKEALELLDKSRGTPDERLDAFFRRCGDAFVAAVHSGARLDGMFYQAMSQAEFNETMTASAKGGVGAFKASASMKKTLERIKTNKELDFEQFHRGGPPGVPTTAEEFWKRIQDFVALRPDQTTPVIIYANSYRTLHNWPSDLRDVGLTPRAAQLLAGQSWRLQELADIYGDAALAPHRYYFPFSKGANTADFARDSLDKSDALSRAAICLRNLAAYCAARHKCDLSEIFKPETEKSVCPALSDQSEDPQFKALVGSAVGGVKPGVEMPPTSGIRKYAEEAKRLFQSPAASVPSTTTNTSTLVSEGLLSPVEVYYRMLAESPIPRSLDANNKRDANDELLRFDWWCANEKGACADSDFSRLSGPNPSATDSTRRSFKAWIARTKLRPISASLCEQEGHPMCLSTMELVNLVDPLTPLFGLARNFVEAVVPPTPTPTPKRPPPVRMWGGHFNGMN